MRGTHYERDAPPWGVDRIYRKPWVTWAHISQDAELACRWLGSRARWSGWEGEEITTEKKPFPLGLKV